MAPPSASEIACTGAIPAASFRCPAPFTTNDAMPDIVLGDQDFQGNTVAPTTLDYAIAPSFLATDGQKLLAVDGARIVGWNPAPQASHARIDFSIGQPSLVVNAANNGGISASSLGSGRNALTIDGGKLIVADPANNRVLVWNVVPSSTARPGERCPRRSPTSRSSDAGLRRSTDERPEQRRCARRQSRGR